MMTLFEWNCAELESLSIEYMLSQGYEIRKNEQCPQCLRLKYCQFSRYKSGVYICACGAAVKEEDFLVSFTPNTTIGTGEGE